jgi:hypothetical protein
MHNPLRSESEMFRIVVVVGLAALPVILLGLAVSPGAGAILLAVELLVGVWLVWSRSRGVEPHEAEVAAGGDGVYRLLVAANETVGGHALLDEIEQRCAGRRSEILVVVPVLAPSRLAHLAHDVDGAMNEAQGRLDHSLRTMSSAGLRARGYVGDHHDPNTALEDALREFAADEVIVSTHPPERSRWLEAGVVERARRDIPLPVTHVVVDLKAEAAATPA